MAKDRIRFAQTARGEQFIKVGDKEVSFDLNKMDYAELSEVVNGCANILSTVACIMNRFDRLR